MPAKTAPAKAFIIREIALMHLIAKIVKTVNTFIFRQKPFLHKTVHFVLLTETGFATISVQPLIWNRQ
jgi:hypothetical protein